MKGLQRLSWLVALGTILLPPATGWSHDRRPAPEEPSPTPVPDADRRDLIYVPSYQGAGLLEIDPQDPDRRRTVKTRGFNNHLVAWNSVLQEFYVGLENGSEVAVVSATSFTLVGAFTQSVGWNTASMAVSPNGERLLLVCSGSSHGRPTQRILLFSTRERALLQEAALTTSAGDPFPGRAFADFDPDGELVWVSAGLTLRAHDADTLVPVAAWQIPADGALGPFTWSPEGSTLYVLADASLVAWSTLASRVAWVAQLPEWAGEQAPTMSRDGRALWVGGTAAVYRVDASTGRYSTLRLEKAPAMGRYHLAESVDGETLYVTVGEDSHAELQAIHWRTGAVVCLVGDVPFPAMLFVRRERSSKPTGDCSAGVHTLDAAKGLAAAGYTLRLGPGQEEVTVWKSGPPGLESPVFLGRCGIPVGNVGSLRQLATAYWMVERRFRSPGTRARSELLDALIRTARDLRWYSISQDAVSRLTVELLVAVASNGATAMEAPIRMLSKAVPSTLGSPRTYLFEIAVQGVTVARDAYQEEESLLALVQPSDYDAALLNRAFAAHRTGVAAEQTSVPFMNALLPQKGRDLVWEAIESAGSELFGIVTHVPPQTRPAAFADMLYAAARTERQVPGVSDALRVLAENLKTARDVSAGADHEIDRWIESGVLARVRATRQP
jgi:hypothetical protein